MHSNQQTAPHNPTAERIVLGALLNDSSQLFDVSEVLKPEQFYRDIHSKIFRSMLDISATGRKPSLQQIVARVGDEYEDGKSTVHLLTSILRDAEKDEALSPFDFVDLIIDEWARRQIAITQQWIGKELGKNEKQPQEFLSEINERFQEIGLQTQAAPVITLGESAKRAVASSIRVMETGEVIGMGWGLPTLNEVIGPVKPGDLGFIGAAPSGGKTVVALQLCRAAQDALLFELEMDHEDLSRRELSGDAGIPVSQIEEGTYDMFTKGVLEKVRDGLEGERVYIDDRPALTWEQIKARIIQMKRSKGIRLAVIDHLRLVRTTKRVRDKFERAEYITSEAKALAKALKIAIIFLTQRSRTSLRRDSWIPRLDDFDAGPSVDQDADWVLGLARPEQWLKNNKPRLPPNTAPEDDFKFKAWLDEMKKYKGKIEFYGLKRRKGDTIMRDAIFDGAAGRCREIEC